LTLIKAALAPRPILASLTRCRHEHSRYVLSGVGAGRVPGLRGRTRLLFAPVRPGPKPKAEPRRASSLESSRRC